MAAATVANAAEPMKNPLYGDPGHPNISGMWDPEFAYFGPPVGAAAAAPRPPGAGRPPGPPPRPPEPKLTPPYAKKFADWRKKFETGEQEPDTVVAWRSTSGAKNDGRVSFEPLGANRTRVTLELDVEPEDAIEKAGDALGFVERQVEGDLRRFKEFIESRGSETGAWRGEVKQGTTAS